MPFCWFCNVIVHFTLVSLRHERFISITFPDRRLCKQYANHLTCRKTQLLVPSNSAVVWQNHEVLRTMHKSIWPATWEKVPFNICAQIRLKSACASAQTDQSINCPREETLIPWLSKMRRMNILIRLRECAGWSESSLGAYAQRSVVWRCGSFGA